MAKRIDAKNKIDSLRREEENFLPPLQAKIEEVKEQISKLEIDRKALLERLSGASAELAKEKFRVSGEIGQNEIFLLESYDPRIDEGIKFFQDKLEDLRRPGKINTQKMGGKLNVFTMRKESKTASNAFAVERALRFCMAVIKELEAAKLDPEYDLGKIEIFKKSIPRIDEYQEETAERNVRGPDDNPLHFLKSDSQIQWEMEKIDKDFEKWKRGKGRFKGV